jgi:hypothetical protein
MKVCSIFSQVLKLFSRGSFEKAVKQHKAERHARGFTSWGQFMAMLFCQVGRASNCDQCGGGSSKEHRDSLLIIISKRSVRTWYIGTPNNLLHIVGRKIPDFTR